MFYETPGTGPALYPVESSSRAPHMHDVIDLLRRRERATLGRTPRANLEILHMREVLCYVQAQA